MEQEYYRKQVLSGSYRGYDQSIQNELSGLAAEPAKVTSKFTEAVVPNPLLLLL